MRFVKQTTWTLALCMLGSALGTVAQAQDEQTARMRTALAAPARSDEDKGRDAVRKPIETVGPSGKVYAQNPDFFVQREGFIAAEKTHHDRLGNVTAVHGELAAAGIVGQADAAITALNLHDIYNSQGGEAGAVAFLKGVYDALKPGAVFGVIDHVGIAGQNNAQFHRIEVQVARDVIKKAGFTIEAESNILANPADDHTKGVRDMARHTDQFLIRARKPK
jgi:predicted methyltransferase